MFRQFLSQYLELAVSDWMAVLRVCREIDNRSKEISEPMTSKLSGSTDTSEDESFESKDSYLTLNQTANDSEPALNPVCHLREGLNCRREGRAMVIYSNTPTLTSITQNKDCSICVGEDTSSNFGLEQMPAKRPRTHWGTCLPTEDDTATSAESAYYMDEECLERQSLKNADVSKVSSDVDHSGLVYTETSLDKMIDCLTRFKYSLQRLHSSQLLTLPNEVDACSSVISCIFSSYDRLEALYEAMAKSP